MPERPTATAAVARHGVPARHMGGVRAAAALLALLLALLGAVATSLTIAHAYEAGTLTWESGGQYTAEAFAAAADCRTWRPGDGPERAPDGPDAPDLPCGNSFAADARVLLADGTTEPIAEVEAGESVLARDPRTGEAGPRAVTGVIVGAGEKRLVALTLAVGGGTATLTATANHPFWLASAGRWAYAEELRPGDLLLTAEGSWARVLRADEVQTAATVYNLSVAGVHTFFVAAPGTGAGAAVLVHNAICPDFDNVWKSLAPGRNPGVRLVDSEEELNQLFNELTVGATEITRGSYPGEWYRRSDGILVGKRSYSSDRSGGAPTIDVELPTGQLWKIHVRA